LLHSIPTTFKRLSNEFFYRLRKHLPALRSAPYEEKLERPFAQDIFPAAVAEKMNEESLRQALFYAWVLERVPVQAPSLQKPAKVLDLGSKNFVYVPALARFLSQHFSRYSLTGLEIDPYRVYRDFYRRGDYAKYYASIAVGNLRGGSEIQYETGDWLLWKPTEHWDLITCFFPFLYEDLHDRFGLRPSSFSPAKFYEKALKNADQVLFFHQGKKERDDSIALIQKMRLGKITFQETFFGNPWMKRKFPVEVVLWNKKTD
jgi:hypothetical protein